MKAIELRVLLEELEAAKDEREIVVGFWPWQRREVSKNVALLPSIRRAIEKLEAEDDKTPGAAEPQGS